MIKLGANIIQSEESFTSSVHCRHWLGDHRNHVRCGDICLSVSPCHRLLEIIGQRWRWISDPTGLAAKAVAVMIGLMIETVVSVRP